MVFASGAIIGVGSRSVEAARRDLTIAYNLILRHARQLCYHEVSKQLTKA